MAIGTMTAIILGATALGATAMMTSSAQKQSKSQSRLAEQQLEAQRKATAEVLAAPDKAAETARLDALARRRRRAKTLLTSPTGVLEPTTIVQKELFGE